MITFIEWRANNNIRQYFSNKYFESTPPVDIEALLSAAIDTLKKSDPKAAESISLALNDSEVANELLTQYEQFANQMQSRGTLTLQAVFGWLKQQASQPYVSLAKHKAAAAGMKFNQPVAQQQVAPAQKQFVRMRDGEYEQMSEKDVANGLSTLSRWNNPAKDGSYYTKDKATGRYVIVRSRGF